jgi:hypothetical protein
VIFALFRNEIVEKTEPDERDREQDDVEPRNHRPTLLLTVRGAVFSEPDHDGEYESNQTNEQG